MKMKKSFASDNWSGTCPEIMTALADANKGHAEAYGELDDVFTARAKQKFIENFGEDIDVFFVYNGTAANVLGVSHLINSYHAIVAARSAHLNEDECGAPEKFIGCKLLELESTDGKIQVRQIKPLLKSIGFQHHAQPKVISISQVTEMGTVYSIDEIKELADFAHSNSMFLHVDGARIANAAVSLNADFKSMITDTGVDVLSFGGTKNGLMFGEAVVFLNKGLAVDFEYRRKQGMQLHSKMRFIAAQFERYLTDDLWRENASRANLLAKHLEEEMNKIPQLEVSQDVNANGVFVYLPEAIIEKVREKYFFHVWNESPQGKDGMKEVRLMCSWDTTKDDVAGLGNEIKEALGNC
ncbi:MAG: low specificity L-threonine aldolase [Chlorobi bacterium]|nr:low specificity L-threonine aldolase [Chlorobiota bacterium]